MTLPTNSESLLLCFFFFFFCSFCFHIPSTWAGESRICPGSYGPFIQPPFCLNDTAKAGCTDPNYAVKCDAQNRTILTLPSAGEFAVKDINYDSQKITFNDLDSSCIPRRFLNGNFNIYDAPPFGYEALNQNLGISFFNCSPEVAKNWANYTAIIKVIECLSGENFTVVVAPDLDGLDSLSSCLLLKNASAPATWIVCPDLVGDDLLTLEWRPRTGFYLCSSGAASRGGMLSWGAKYGVVFGIGIILFLIKHKSI